MEDRIIVLTIHGKDEIAEYVTIQTFKSAKAAHMYVESMTENNDNLWVRCEFVEEWKKYRMRRVYTGEKFKTELLRLNDRSIQKLMREIDAPDLGRALNGADNEVKDKIFRNFSKRAGEMLKEEMDLMALQKADYLKAQEKILYKLEMLIAEGDIPDYEYEATI